MDCGHALITLETCPEDQRLAVGAVETPSWNRLGLGWEILWRA